MDAEDEDKADDALEKYSWRLKDGWWEHVKSRYVNARQESRINVDHRLYLNPDSTYTHAIVNAMVDKYEEKGVPYYFKFSPSGDRADTIVIYSSTKDLLNNLTIVRQVKKEHPEFVKHMHRPPILTGVIEDNIGYGAEPEDKSYSEDRADILYSAIKGASLDWVAKHQNDIIDYKGKQVPFSEFIIDKEMVAVAEELNSHYNYHNKYDREAAERKNPGNVDEIALQQEITKSVGCDADDLKEDSKMYRYFKSVVRSNFSNIVDSLQKTGKCDLSVKLKNDKKLALGGDYFVCAIAKAAPDIAKHDHAFLNDIRSRVRKGCIEHQIDSDKFVFDNLTVQKMAKEGNG